MEINNFNLGNNFRASQMQQNNVELNPEDLVKVEKKEVEVKEEPVVGSAFKDSAGEWHVINDGSNKTYEWDNKSNSYRCTDKTYDLHPGVIVFHDKDGKYAGQAPLRRQH